MLLFRHCELETDYMALYQKKREPAMRGWFVFSPIQNLSREIAAKNVVKWTRDPERNSIDIHACYFRGARNSHVVSLKG